jgi:hypothetical protein
LRWRPIASTRRELDEVLRFAVPPAAVRDKDLLEETLDHLRKLGYVD